jgi:hypothetical protein
MWNESRGELRVARERKRVAAKRGQPVFIKANKQTGELFNMLDGMIKKYGPE